MNIIVIVEAFGGVLLVALFAVACWHEDMLVEWEDKHLMPITRHICKMLLHQLHERITK